jgi:hypothetical protein
MTWFQLAKFRVTNLRSRLSNVGVSYGWQSMRRATLGRRSSRPHAPVRGTVVAIHAALVYLSLRPKRAPKLDAFVIFGASRWIAANVCRAELLNVSLFVGTEHDNGLRRSLVLGVSGSVGEEEP